MRKLLIVSPRFPPANAADLHRVRVSLPHYAARGWEPTVLCADAATADGVFDQMLSRSLPPGLRIVQVRAWPERRCRWFGFGQLSYRSLIPLYRAGCRLLRRERYDVVFFSTTVFLCFVLGRLWRWRYGCRIVYDFQDPWWSDDLLYTRATVPGAWWKYRFERLLARYLERFAIGAADHVITVSAGYVETLSRRYPRLGPDRFTVLPFAAAADDYRFARGCCVGQRVFARDPNFVRWVYVGRGGSDMNPVLAALFSAVARLRAQDPQFAARLRLHFVGTNYAPAARSAKLVEPLAAACGVGDLVAEVAERVPYFEAIALHDDCDAVLLIGSVHADYTASKLLTCVAAKKPVLALFHRQSLVSRIAAQFPNVFLATFERTPEEAEFRARLAVGLAWLRTAQIDAAAVDELLQPWSAAAMTREQCAVFDRVAALADRRVKASP